MSGKNIGIKRFFKPVKIQPNKANDVREDGIEKIPQIQETIPVTHIPSQGF